MTIQYALPHMLVTKHWFDLPLNHEQPQKEHIKVFARVLERSDKQGCELPWLVYFQGGPGFAAQRPVSYSGWIKRALAEYRVLLLDQRGTGLSSPINWQSLENLSALEQAEYLSFFRADNIVRDAEAIRAQLSPDKPWTALGQSFGGFCITHYLSAAPEGLLEAYITGGIPPIGRSAEDVYRATFKRLTQKNKEFYQRFPDAAFLVTQLRDFLITHEVLLPTGKRLNVNMLQLLGIHLGMEEGPEAIYYLIEQSLQQGPHGLQINPLFIERFMQMLDYNTNPLFAVLHEAIYCEQQSSQWAAQRVRQEHPQFAPEAEDLLFTGEMIFPWMFDGFSNLAPLKACAELLAAKSDWPTLYNLDVLAKNKVPVAAAVYTQDMFVEVGYSLDAIEKISNLKTWVTSEFEHNGIRMDGERILDKLIALNRNQCLR